LHCYREAAHLVDVLLCFLDLDHIGERAVSAPPILTSTGNSITDGLAGVHEKSQCLGSLRKKSSANSSAFSAPYEIESFSKRKTAESSRS
jgi:hypothetical protein